MKNILRLAALLTLLLMPGMRAQAQSRYSEKEYARKPLWAAMMADTASNFFEVEKAYRIYFAHHEEPEGEEAEMGEHTRRIKYNGRQRRRITAENKLRMDVKRYRFWREQTLPYVQADGRILTPTERLAIWQRQQHRQ